MSPVNRITGFSGFDTESLVQKLMTAERMPLDKLKFKKQQMTWKQDMYRDINKSFKSLFDIADKLRLNANWSQFKTTSSDEASVSALGVTASGTHTVEVTQLASGAKLQSTSSVDFNAKLTDLDGSLQTSITLSVNGNSVTIDNSNGDKTLQDVMNAVNSAGPNVRMTYNGTSKTFAFVNTITGASSKIDIVSGGTAADTLLNQLGFSSSNRSATGTDAFVTIDGITRTSSTNTITENGVTYTLKKLTIGSPVTVKSERDVDALVKQIKDFVTEYNKTVESISSKLREKVNRTIQPMSEEDRKNIKEADLKLWEDAAKKGLLRSDDILSKALVDMRMTLYGGVKGVRADGKDAYLSTIGITTASFTGGNGGELVKSVAAMDGMLEVNEEKLRKTLQEDPETVIKTFTNYPGDSVPKDSPDYQAQKGIMHRFKELFETVQKDISIRIDNKGQVGGENDFSLEKQIRDMNRRMEDMEERLKQKEDQYYKRFAQMEKIMSQGSAQSSWLAAQMGKM
ncbi:flagellar filament capping protein FliD [Aneurinibacillus sp. UBA3580]|jgi:flagellar hook-associated protein 2|uniref:flagellar filament capping protein FliD n=1 Tax=Aneurinibacillus sp. UBA3580 TaxID=1946041 RepID=UPI00257C6BCB|nr:flagellar filament capping protein FliD [Aneurinibacillus sp. UBA3580]